MLMALAAACAGPGSPGTAPGGREATVGEDEQHTAAIDSDEWVPDGLLEFRDASDAVVFGTITDRAASDVRVGSDAGLRYDVWAIDVHDVVAGLAPGEVRLILMATIDGRDVRDGTGVESPPPVVADGTVGLWFLTELASEFEAPTDGEHYVLTNSEGFVPVDGDRDVQPLHPDRPAGRELAELGTLDAVADHLDAGDT
jgi:hypothetical protein